MNTKKGFNIYLNLSYSFANHTLNQVHLMSILFYNVKKQFNLQSHQLRLKWQLNSKRNCPKFSGMVGVSRATLSIFSLMANSFMILYFTTFHLFDFLTIKQEVWAGKFEQNFSCSRHMSEQNPKIAFFATLTTLCRKWQETYFGFRKIIHFYHQLCSDNGQRVRCFVLSKRGATFPFLGWMHLTPIKKVHESRYGEWSYQKLWLTKTFAVVKSIFTSFKYASVN